MWLAKCDSAGVWFCVHYSFQSRSVYITFFISFKHRVLYTLTKGNDLPHANLLRITTHLRIQYFGTKSSVLKKEKSQQWTWWLKRNIQVTAEMNNDILSRMLNLVGKYFIGPKKAPLRWCLSVQVSLILRIEAKRSSPMLAWQHPKEMGFPRWGESPFRGNSN